MFILSLFLGIIFAFVYEIITGIIGKKLFHQESIILLGYKLHHSLYGILSLFIFLFNKKIFYLGFGLGIILQHSITDSFNFIQKV